ncbi:YbjQ family protein [Lentisphaerota bacterium WC36G]|nr:YbjQ family protein [Lentisphaerae bacterium WC36]
MIVVNCEEIPGKKIIEVKGLVQGNTVRTKHAGRDFMAVLKNLVGGELTGYTELLVEARRQATERMMAQANELKANAIINVRFATSSVMSGAAELYVYGTAVTVEDI